jgi:hypothetical protein
MGGRHQRGPADEHCTSATGFWGCPAELLALPAAQCVAVSGSGWFCQLAASEVYPDIPGFRHTGAENFGCGFLQLLHRAKQLLCGGQSTFSAYRSRDASSSVFWTAYTASGFDVSASARPAVLLERLAHDTAPTARFLLLGSSPDSAMLLRPILV